MDDFGRVKKMNDKRWNNVIKRDLIKKAVEVSEADRVIRIAALSIEANAKDEYSSKLKQDIKIYRNALKLAKNDNKDLMLTGLSDHPVLLQRFKYLTPHEIELSIMDSIQKITRECNIIKRKNKLQRLKLNKLKKYESNIFTQDFAVKEKIIGKMADFDKRIAAVELTNRKTENMVNILKKNLIMYDNLTNQLEKDAENLAIETLKIIETGTTFKEDESNYFQLYKEYKRNNLKLIEKESAYISRIISKEKLLEYNRSLSLQEPKITDIESTIYSKIPSILDAQPENKAVDNSNKWYEKFLNDGLVGFVNEQYEHKIQEHIKNNSNYQFPNDNHDFLTIDTKFPTTDQVAVDYVSTQLGFYNKDDMLANVKFNKTCFERLVNLASLKYLMWTMAIEKLSQVYQYPENVYLLSNSEIEFDKHKNILQPFVYEQTILIREMENLESHYIKLFNKMIFSLENLEAKFEKIQVPILRNFHLANKTVKNYRRELYELVNKIDPCSKVKSQDSLNGTNRKDLLINKSNAELSMVEKCLKIIDKLDSKFNWCMKVVDDFDLKNMTTAIACYEFEAQRFIQKQFIKSAKQQNLVVNRPDSRELDKDTGILSRNQRKIENQEIVNYFKTPKDTDDVKNTRKPISFRTDTIVIKKKPVK